MTTPIADRAILDTNVLLATTDESRQAHGAAVAVVDSWPRSGTVLYTSGQILREYLSAATRPVEQNGLGMARAQAVANVRAFRLRLPLLTENVKVHERLLQLLDSVACSGKQVHDANVVATVLTHGIHTVVTGNIGTSPDSASMSTSSV